jgi:hypothetical protein
VTTKQKGVVIRIAEIIKKHITKELMRGFWKIDRINDPEDSMTNMSGANTPLLYSRGVSRPKNYSRNTSQSKNLPPKTPSKMGSPADRRATPDNLNKSAINVKGNY